jgi:hypothetical protein
MGVAVTYTYRPTWPDNPNSIDDFVFKFSGHDVGRCYLKRTAHHELKWSWTIYIGGGPDRASRSVYGIAIAGAADTLDDAKAAFKKSFEKMREAGVVRKKI